MSLSPRDAVSLVSLLEARGLTHLAVKKRGDSLTIYSESDGIADKRAKLTALGLGNWGLSLPRHTGRWEKTPFIGTMEELVALLFENFQWFLAPDPDR